MTTSDPGWPALPTETEIYILPTGEVVIADLPTELAEVVEHLTTRNAIACAQNSEVMHVAEQQHSSDPAESD